MGELDDDALEEARSRSDTLELWDLFEILETHRVDGGRGVSLETVEAYADALNYDLDAIHRRLDDQSTDSQEWESGGAIHRLGEDRFSVFPPRWHEELGDTTDLTRHVALIHSSVTATEGEQSEAVTEAGVPERKVVQVARGVSGMDRDAARGKLEDLRKRGDLEASTDQHPDSAIRVPDRE